MRKYQAYFIVEIWDEHEPWQICPVCGIDLVGE